MTDFIIIFLADYLIYLLALGVVLYCLGSGNRRLLRQCLITAVISWTIGFVIKNFFYLPRPYIVSGFIPLAGFYLDGSFPSNHTTIAMGLTFPILWQHRLAGLIAVFGACLVAFGRVLGGVHTIMDITAGIFISGLVSLAVYHRG
jgi:undecaprenyl-diphosphatase